MTSKERLSVVIHSLDQARTVLEIAAQRKIKVQLVSPAGGTRMLGGGFFHKIGEALGVPVVIDCGAHQGDAVALIRLGSPCIRASCRADFQVQLESLAANAGVELRTRLPKSLIMLDRGDEGDEIAAKMG